MMVSDDGQRQDDRLPQAEWVKRLTGGLLLAHGPGQLSSPAAFHQALFKDEGRAFIWFVRGRERGF